MSSLVRYPVPRTDRPVSVSGSATGKSRIVTPGKAAASVVAYPFELLTPTPR